MKKYLLCTALLFFINHVFAQDIFNFKATKYLMVFYDQDKDFTIATTWKDTSMNIILDVKGRKVIFTGKTEEVFKITNDGVQTKDNIGFRYLKYYSCIDSKGVKCNIRYAIPPEDPNFPPRPFLYLDYGNISYQYLLSIDFTENK